jgi:DegV family protein with EDD domain
MAFTIFTDSGANITDKVRDHYGIKVISLTLVMEGEEFQFTSSEEFDYEGYYEKLKDGLKVSTSQINPSQFIEAFEPELEKGNDILYVGLSGGVTGTINSAKIAASDLMEDFPERRIMVVDSLGASLGEGILVTEAAECARKGMTLEETADRIEFQKYCMYQVFVVDDLKHLKRTGRISGALASLGTMMDIKPILKGNTEGKIVVECKARGRKQAIKALAEEYRDLVVNAGEQTVGLSYGGKR